MVVLVLVTVGLGPGHGSDLTATEGPARALLPQFRGHARLSDGVRGERLALSDFMADRIRVLSAEAGGPVLDLAVPAGPRGLLAADWDSDGRPDLAVASASAHRVSVLLDRGGSSFERSAELWIEGIPIGLSRVEAAGTSPGSRLPVALRVHCADGGIVQYRSLGAGYFDPHPETIRAAPVPEEAAPTVRVAAAGKAPPFNTPLIDFTRHKTCLSAFPKDARPRSLGTNLKNARKSFAKGAKTRPIDLSLPFFSDAAQNLFDYADTLQSEVPALLTQQQADSCALPARSDADAILLIGHPDRIEIVGGDGQSGVPSQTLAVPLSVRVLDGYDNPLAGVEVEFALNGSAGDGLSETLVPTDASGLASTLLTLGTSLVEVVTVEAGVPSSPAEPAVFTAHRVVPARIEIVSGDGQTARPFDPLASPLAVRILDAHGVALAGIPVEFTLLGGAASLSQTAAVTNGSGLASTRLTMGVPPDGDILVNAGIPGSSLSPAVFTVHKETGIMSLALDVQPLFNRSCAVSGCHDHAQRDNSQLTLVAGMLFSEKGIVDVDSFGAPALKRVKPFDPGASYLINKLEGTQKAVGGEGDRMPAVGDPLGAREMFLIEAWISQGAASNETAFTSRGRVPPAR